MMKSRKFIKVFSMILCIVTVSMIFPITANADMGPKPSVRITFKNLGDELCYGTLLSSKESTGPASAWNGKEEDAQEDDLKGGQNDVPTLLLSAAHDIPPLKT